MVKKLCKICDKEINPRRVALGYSTTCVNHSSAERYTGIIAASGKTDYELIVIKDPKIGKHLVELSNIY